MSHITPASFKGGPVTTNAVAANRYILIYILLFWLSLLPDFFLITHFFYKFEMNFVWIFIMFPLQIFIWYILFVLGAIFWSWLVHRVVIALHRPREGIFPRDRKNVDYRYWTIRAVIMKFPLWVCHTFPFPWIDILVFKMFGNNVPLRTPMFDAWIDSEFIEIDQNSTIGQGSVVMSSMITTEFLIIKRVKIGKNCVVGGHAVISPGTVMPDNVVLGAFSATSYGQVLEPNWVYMGNPATKYRENKFREKDGLSAKDRAKTKGYIDLAEKLPEGVVVSKSRKVDRMIRKSARKERKAAKAEGKAQYHHTKAEFSHLREKLKAERQERIAEKKRFQSEMAMLKAKMAVLDHKEKEKERVEKDQAKLVKNEEKEKERQEKNQAKLEKKEEKTQAKLVKDEEKEQAKLKKSEEKEEKKTKKRKTEEDESFKPQGTEIDT